MVALSVLDLAPIPEGRTACDAFASSVSLARHAESLGYERFWLAEHHNMPGIASAATAVVIGHVAAHTSRIRVGAGGIMLPNHAPLVIAEQFGTLASMYGDRIDLGIGRAPGTDMRTAHALRRPPPTRVDTFPRELAELRQYFEPRVAGSSVNAVPGVGLRVPVYLLGSSLYSAELAGKLGLPFAFASHFAPEALMQALAIYRETFTPSEALREPYVIVGTNVIAADTDAEAHRLASSIKQMFIALRRGTPGQLPPPVDDIDRVLSPEEQAGIRRIFARSVVGSKETVREGVRALVRETGANELIVAAQIFDHDARLRSYEILAEVRA